MYSPEFCRNLSLVQQYVALLLRTELNMFCVSVFPKFGEYDVGGNHLIYG